MRTTLTLDDDVAALLGTLERQGKGTMKELVNSGLREGLRVLQAKERRTTAYETRRVSLGRCRLPQLDDVADALAAAEDEAFR